MHMGSNPGHFLALTLILALALALALTLALTLTVPPLVEFSKCSPSYNNTGAAGILTESAFICSNPLTGNSHSGCAELLYPTRRLP